MENRVELSGNQKSYVTIEAICYWVITLLDALLVVGMSDGVLFVLEPSLFDGSGTCFLIQLVFVVGSVIGCILYNSSCVHDCEFKPSNYFFSALSSLAGLVILSIIVSGILAILFAVFFLFVFIPFATMCILLVGR